MIHTSSYSFYWSKKPRLLMVTHSSGRNFLISTQTYYFHELNEAEFPIVFLDWRNFTSHLFISKLNDAKDIVIGGNMNNNNFKYKWLIALIHLVLSNKTNNALSALSLNKQTWRSVLWVLEPLLQVFMFVHLCQTTNFAL